MPKSAKTVRTYHPLAVIDSLQEQSNKVGLLLATVDTILSLHPDLKGGDALRKAAEECRHAMYPEESFP